MKRGVPGVEALRMARGAEYCYRLAEADALDTGRCRGAGSRNLLIMQEFRMGNSHAERIVSSNHATTSRAPRGDALLFARNFFRHPRMLGSIIPSSRFLIKQLLQPIDWEKARVIVEYGPGVGGITAEILRRMRPDARLIAIETNPEFVAFLRRSLVDERFHVTEGSAASVKDIL